MSRASWSKLGGGRLRRDCPELELARGLGQGHGVQAPGEGARRVVGLRLEAGLRGGAAACGAAGRAAAGAQREVLRLSGVVHAVGGPDVCAASSSLSFCELTQVLIWRRRPLMKSVSRAPWALCSCGVSAKSSMTTSTW